jgi:RimJ/RimL family protein N-acetyltransferase
MITPWITHPAILKGQKITLVPLDETHFEELATLGQGNETIWKYSPTGVNGYARENALAFLKTCLVKRDTGEWYPFVTMINDTGKIAGFTLYHTIKPEHKTLEIGATWLHPDHWAKGFNAEAKYLQLTHCFETLNTMRVQLKASHDNIRSRKAIEKIGATFEGILRKDKILEDGTIRNAAYYSIIDDEWAEVKQKLQQMLQIK